MPTYFFHTDDHKRIEDEVGTELPNDAKAVCEAIRLAGAMMQNDPRLLFGGCAFRTEVVTDAGDLLFTIVARVEPRRPE